MSSSTDVWKDQGSFVNNIEQQMDDYLKAQKDQIEQGLMEKINREKEEARRRIEETEKEFNKEKAILDEYKTILAELRAEREKLVGLIREHFDRTQNCQRQIKIMTDQADEELRKVSELSQEIENVRGRVVAENARLKKELKEKFGITADIPSMVEIGDIPADWSQEASRIEKIRDLLSSIEIPRSFEPSDKSTSNNGGKGEADPVPVDPVPVDPVPVELEPVELEPVQLEAVQPEPMRPEPARVDPPSGETRGFGVPREEYTEDEITREIEAVDAGPETEPRAAGEDFGNLLSGLIPFKKTEPIQGERKFGYFQNAELKVLDGEMFIRTMIQIAGVAKELHSQLGGMESIKDLFMLKQEILNEQEILRKLFLRAVVFCEKEDGSLPYYISEVINTRSLKDALERLTIGNWSDPAEFDVFMKDINRLRDEFFGRVTDLEQYMKSVLGQLEIGD